MHCESSNVSEIALFDINTCRKRSIFDPMFFLRYEDVDHIKNIHFVSVPKTYQSDWDT